MKVLTFFVNGRKIEEPSPDPRVTLLQYLRQKLCLTGTKDACNQGGCGSCTVMLSWQTEEGEIRHVTVNACLVPLCYIHGYAVTTVEGVGNSRTGLHDIQKRLVESHGLQCGFCTPGMVMSVYGLFKSQSTPSQQQLEKSLEGNLCRCTGYRPIVEAFKPLCCDECKTECKKEKDIEDICKNKCEQEEKVTRQDLSHSFKLLKHSERVEFKHGEIRWIRPIDVNEVRDILAIQTDVHIVMGATQIATVLKQPRLDSGTFVCCNSIKELQSVRTEDGELCVGSAVTLTQLYDTLQELSQTLPGENKQVVHVLCESLRSLACDQIRNISTIGGNVMATAKVTDLPTVLMALGTKITFLSKEGHEDFTVTNAFFEGSIQTLSSTGSLLTSLNIPLHLNEKNFSVSFYKQQKKEGFDQSKVNTCFSVMVDGQGVIQSLNLCFGGVLSTHWSATETSLIAIGRKINAESLKIISDSLMDEVKKKMGIDGNLYITIVMRNYLEQFWNGLEKGQGNQSCKVDFIPSSSTCVYEDVDQDQPNHDSVGKPIPTVTAPSLVTGEAMFIDDIPRYANELFMAFVLSTRSHATILSVDTSKALAVQGVVEYLDSSCIPGAKTWGILTKDEPVFADKEVTCCGQVIGAVLAEDEAAARRGVELVNVEYEDLPSIITIEEAIEAEAFFKSPSNPILRGDPDGQFDKCDNVLDDSISSGFQEHFYMEPQITIAVPKNESNEIEIFSATQAITFTQECVASILNIPANRVIVRQKRLGGGFGGKEYRSSMISGPAAVAASRHGRPVRCRLSRKEDIKITGKRQEALTKYKVGYTKNGMIEAVLLRTYGNGGNTDDISRPVVGTFMMNADGSYYIPHFRIEGHVCRTNTPSNTSLRGFGVPEAAYVMETIISEVAFSLGMSSEKVREMSMYKNGDETPYRQLLENCNLQRCWQECKQKSEFITRKIICNEFNSKNKKKKKAIVMQPVKMTIGYRDAFLNQGCALIQVYLDGSILLAHGGVEMGQGLNTKMIQVASRALGVPIDKIYISEAGTNTVPNTVSTSASITSDLSGAAVIDACSKIVRRINPYKLAKPDGSWNDWVLSAYFDRVSLSATGFGKPGNPSWDDGTCQGRPALYFSYGAGCTEVEIDCLTGQHRVLRQDIVMDVGKSLNPAIDIGQIEGAFLQGYGWMTMEEINVSSDGELMVEGPLEYKIPGVNNIPRQLNVSLLKDCPNEKAVYSSKGIGEPPLILSIGVYLAIKEAVISARNDAGLTEKIKLEIPLTTEKICMACNGN